MQRSQTVRSVPRIDVMPEHGPVDGELSIALSGFPPRCAPTLRATLHDPRKRAWSSQAVFQTDGSGAVDLASAAPESGCYTGADVEGLLWSLEPTDPAPRAPFDESSVAPLRLMFSAELDGASVATATVERTIVRSDCRVIAVKEDGLVGTLFQPAGDGPFPTVLVVGGSAGREVFSGQCAALLAGHGYASLALSYFAAEGLPRDLVGIPLEYFARAIGWLRARPFARGDGVAVVGRSRGGELALLLGATFPDVRAVVGYSPSDMVCGGLRDNKSIEASAWTYRERDVPHRGPRPTTAEIAEIIGKPPIALRPLFELPVDPQVASAAAIPVERIRGPVVLFSGDDDRMWPASVMCDAVIARLEKHGHPHAFAHHRYPGAGHLLRAPCMPTSVVDAPTWALGGTPRGQALANRRSWSTLLAALSGGVQ
jgi:dienelactone hydrolase